MLLRIAARLAAALPSHCRRRRCRRLQSSSSGGGCIAALGASVGSLLGSSSSFTLHSIAQNASVREAAAMMRSTHIGSLVVRDVSSSSSSSGGGGGGCVSGIVTERDIVRAMAAGAWADVVHAWMTPRSRMLAVSAADSVADCMRIMATADVRHLPVLQGDRVLALLSMRDLVQVGAASPEGSVLRKDQWKVFVSSRRGLPELSWMDLAPKHLRLRLGQVAIPHPDKLKQRKEGEDAALLLTSEELGAPFSVAAVADGVGSWSAEEGIDAGVFAKTLVAEIELAARAQVAEWREARQSESPDAPANISPASLLSVAWERCCSHHSVVGSACVCIAVYDGVHGEIHALNLGDCGLMILRRPQVEASGTLGKVPVQSDAPHFEAVFRSSQQLHEFNCPYQLGIGPDGDPTPWDDPKDANLMRIPTLPGDLIVLATDGLFDNVSEEELLQVLSEEPADTATQELAEKLSKLAFERSLDKDVDSPFAILAKENNIMWGGGMPDDISIIIGRVEEAKEESASTPIRST